MSTGATVFLKQANPFGRQLSMSPMGTSSRMPSGAAALANPAAWGRGGNVQTPQMPQMQGGGAGGGGGFDLGSLAGMAGAAMPIFQRFMGGQQGGQPSQQPSYTQNKAFSQGRAVQNPQTQTPIQGHGQYPGPQPTPAAQAGQQPTPAGQQPAQEGGGGAWTPYLGYLGGEAALSHIAMKSPAAAGVGLGTKVPALYGAYVAAKAPYDAYRMISGEKPLEEWQQEQQQATGEGRGYARQVGQNLMDPGYAGAALGKEVYDTARGGGAAGMDRNNLTRQVEQIGEGTRVDMDRLQNIKMKELQNQPLSQGEMTEKQRLSEKIKADRQKLEELGTFSGALKHVLSNTAWNPMNWG